MADWDADSWQLATNLDRLFLDASWRADSGALDRTVLLRWHSVMMTGLRAPSCGDIGTFRGQGTLRHAVVFVRSQVRPHERIYGVAPEHVELELAGFEAQLRLRLAQPLASIEARAQLAAWVHGELVYIHPFANGNGRIARLAANWVLVRLGSTPVVRLRPRPQGQEYQLAAMESMRDRSHDRMNRWILALLHEDST